MQGRRKKKACAHKYFCQSRKNSFTLNFLSILGPTIYFLSSPPNQTHSKKVFLPIFSPKFLIYPISPPNKHTLNLGLSYYGKLWYYDIWCVAHLSVCSWLRTSGRLAAIIFLWLHGWPDKPSLVVTASPITTSRSHH